jgi:hypothetical protein
MATAVKLARPAPTRLISLARAEGNDAAETARYASEMTYEVKPKPHDEP